MPTPFFWQLADEAPAYPGAGSSGRRAPDVHLLNTADGGEITVSNGALLMDPGLETAVYLSLFGGNERDNGQEATAHLQYWGNLSEPETARRLRSETQSLLRALPATTGNLRKLEDAAARDLAWMQGGAATDVSVAASLPSLNTVRLDISIVIDGRRIDLQFVTSWSART